MPSSIFLSTVLSRVRSRRIAAWLLLGLVVGLAVAIRWQMNFSQKLMPGNNGAYYPVQVRSVLEDGRLYRSAPPLVFYLEALVARVLLRLRVASSAECIVWACKGVDSVLPALAAAPVFLLARAWSCSKRGPLSPGFIASLFSVLYFPALLMTGDFHKNAAGMVWLLFFIYLLQLSLKHQAWKHYLLTGLLLLLTGLTHQGPFGVALLLLVVVVGILLIFRQTLRQIAKPAAIAAVVLLAATVAMCFSFDPFGTRDLLRIALSLFARPMLFAILTGGGMVFGDFANLVNLGIVTVIAILGIILLRRRWSMLSQPDRAVVVAAAVTTLFLASPLIGLRYSGRLLLMAYAPAAVVLAFLLTNLHHRAARWAVAAVALVSTAALSAGILRDGRPASISEPAYSELQQMVSLITEPEKSLVVARHGLEWWAAWVLATDVAEAHRVDAKTIDKYPAVFYLQQIGDTPTYGPAGPAGPPFPEARPPREAEVVFEGRYFRLAKVSAQQEEQSAQHVASVFAAPKSCGSFAGSRAGKEQNRMEHVKVVLLGRQQEHSILITLLDFALKIKKMLGTIDSQVSFPRKRESRLLDTFLDPCLRRGDSYVKPTLVSLVLPTPKMKGI